MAYFDPFWTHSGTILRVKYTVIRPKWILEGSHLGPSKHQKQPKIDDLEGEIPMNHIQISDLEHQNMVQNHRSIDG